MESVVICDIVLCSGAGASYCSKSSLRRTSRGDCGILLPGGIPVLEPIKNVILHRRHLEHAFQMFEVACEDWDGALKLWTIGAD
jgi:hypothetical protein